MSKSDLDRIIKSSATGRSSEVQFPAGTPLDIIMKDLELKTQESLIREAIHRSAMKAGRITGKISNDGNFLLDHTPIPARPKAQIDILSGVKINSPPKQLFILSSEMIDSVDEDEMIATYNDMLELGVAKPPYPIYSIAAPMSHTMQPYRSETGESMDLPERLKSEPVLYHIDHEHDIIQMNLPVYDETFEIRGALNQISDELALQHREHDIALNNINYKISKEMAKTLSQKDLELILGSMPLCAKRLEILLIVLLATKNVEKEVRHNRLAKFGVGKAKAEYTTTLKIGKVQVEYSGEPVVTGRTVRPHLRRGHIRRQKYGPNRELTKSIFIQPVFVNASDEFINQRKAYNVSMK